MLHACGMPALDSCVGFSAAPLKKTSWSIMNFSTFSRAATLLASKATSPISYLLAETRPAATFHPITDVVVSASSMRRAGRITLSSSTCWPWTMVTSALAAVERSVSGAYTR